jgi:outer membrane protein
METEENFVNKMIKCMLAASLALTALNAAAAEARVAYVKVEKILKEAPQTEEIRKKLEKEFSTRTAELRRMQKQISDKEAAPNAAKDSSLSTLRLDFQQKQRELNEDFNLRKNQELGALQERINKTITTISEADGFDLVIYSGIAYASKRMDITDKVIKALGNNKGTQ